MKCKGRGRKWSWPTSRLNPGISMKGLRKTVENNSRDRRLPDRDFKHKGYQLSDHFYRTDNYICMYTNKLKFTNKIVRQLGGWSRSKRRENYVYI
jgi:hypothetical protein